MWKSEKEFGKFVMEKLKREGCDCTRIETAGTVTGMPDMFVQGHGTDFFIELKNIKTPSIKDNFWDIPWRPGQQAWAANYLLHHKGKCTFTLVGLNDGFLIIPMRAYKENDIVCMDDVVCIEGKMTGQKLFPLLITLGGKEHESR